MNQETIQYLNTLNRDFYRTTAHEFDQTRGQSWPGWARLLPHVQPPQNRPLTVLDVGCGNGRFGLFLADNLDCPISYTGVDNNTDLLAHAQAALSNRRKLTAQLIERDVVMDPFESGIYDLIVLFGVIHHIPGASRRLEFLARLAERLAYGGGMAFACWRFYEYERFRERIAPWPEGMSVEGHDYLLDWRRGDNALRYCHYVDDAEHSALVRATGLQEIEAYRADGASGDMNRYSILKK